MTAPTKRNVTLTRGDPYTCTITIPDTQDPDDFTVLAQIRATPTGTLLAEFTETRADRLITLALDGEADVRDLPDRCGGDLQVWYRQGTDDETTKTLLRWQFIVEGDYTREEGS